MGPDSINGDIGIPLKVNVGSKIQVISCVPAGFDMVILHEYKAYIKLDFRLLNRYNEKEFMHFQIQ